MLKGEAVRAISGLPLTENIGTQSVQELFFLVIGSRSIRKTVHSNDLVKFFGGLRCTARRKLEIYNL